MTLKDQVVEDMKNAMRAHDSFRLGTIRLLLAAAKQKEVDERVVLDDNMMVAIVDKLIKQRKDSVTAFTQANRMDLADKEAAEIGRAGAAKPSITGSLPSGETSVASASTRCHAGLSSRALLALKATEEPGTMPDTSDSPAERGG